MSNVAANFAIQNMNAGQMLQNALQNTLKNAPNGLSFAGGIARVPWPTEFILDKLMERSSDCACEYARYIAADLKRRWQPNDTIELPSGKLVVEDDNIFFYPSAADNVFERGNYSTFGEILCTYMDLLETM